ncbi:uncharacterized protein JCM6883_006750 [Sporobolomyces salmoneus]|uniref:uncharacterized protein n=1 Tax=Sporobolomyces salmoneus TaxID=183962 RepID=UPI00317E7289
MPLSSSLPIPAVPSTILAPKESQPSQPGVTAAGGTTGARFKLVFKGNNLSEQENNSIISPLPHPPSPSAPASSTSSSTASPDPEMKPNSSSTFEQFPTSLNLTQPSTSTSTVADGVGDESETVVVKSKKVKGKGKKGKKGSKQRSKDAVLEQPEGAKADSSTVSTTTAGVAEVEVSTTINSTEMVRTTSLNRVCHHHRGINKGDFRMTCSNNPECKTIWCKRCVEKHYLDLTSSNSFVNGTTLLCPVCRNCCKCSSCRKKRKESTRRAGSLSVAASTSTEGIRDSMTPGIQGGEGAGETVVKMEEIFDDVKPVVPSSTSTVILPATSTPIDPSLLPPSTSALASTSVQPIQPASALPSTVPPPVIPAPQPTSSGILKIRVKPPKRPRSERGAYAPQPDESVYPYEEEVVVAPPPPARRGRGGNRRGAGRRASAATSHQAYTQAASVPQHQQQQQGGGASFFARPPSLMPGIGVAAGGGPRPKRTKKVSSHYDDFAVEGMPNFEGEGEGTHPGSEGPGTPGAVGGRETRSGVGRWGGYRRGAGGRRKFVEPQIESQHHPLSSSNSHSTLPFPSTSILANQASMIGRDGKPRRRPRLSGLSSASSCSELSSAGGMEDDEDDFEARYWDAKEALAERESDQRVRHWLLVPPTEPQPVLAGLEMNLCERQEEEVGFEMDGAHGKKRKEKVKWIEGPERRRRRALALQKMQEEEEAKIKGLSRGVVKDDDEMQDETSKVPLKRSLSWDGTNDQAKELYNHCSPIKPFGDGSSSSSTTSPTSTRKPLPLPTRPSSAPLLSASTSIESVVPPPTRPHLAEAVYSDQPPPYESHFPPSINAPLSSSNAPTPAIVVSPATTSVQTPRSLPSSVPISPSSTAPSDRHPLTNESTCITSEADADLAARSADDKRLGLRLLDAIRTITGTKLAMEAMGIPPSALPAPPSTALPPSTSARAPPFVPPVPSPSSTSPGKSESEEAFSVLISQEHAEYEAIRREERQRLLSTALDPRKVFRAEAKGNDVSLLDRAAEWSGGSMDVDSDESDRRSRSGDAPTGGSLSFDLETFLVAEEPSESVWTASNSTSFVTCSPLKPSHDLSNNSTQDLEDVSPRSIPILETPSKLVPSSHHHLVAPVPLFASEDTSHAWNSTGVPIGRAATPTRGLVMGMEFDFESAIGGDSWISSLGEQ